MNNYGKKLFIMITTTFVMLTSVVIYETYVDNSNYNKEYGYIDNLSDIKKIYDNFDALKQDLVVMNFLQTGPNTFERSYNKFLCERVVLDNQQVNYYVTDACFNVYENEVKKDFDNDGIDMLYYVDPNGKYSYLRFSGEQTGGIQKYDFATEEFEISGMIINEYEIVKYNNSYMRFIKQINALVF